MLERYRKNITIVLSVAFIGFLIWSTVAFQNFFLKIVPIFENLARDHSQLSILIFILLAIISTLLTSFSSVVLVPIAILVWGNALTALFLFIGWTAGDALSYFIGYYAGNPIIKRFLPFEKIRYYLKKIPPDAEFKLIVLFILAMPSEIPAYAVGTIRYRFAKYFAATFLCEILFSSFTAYAGGALVENKPVIFFGSIVLAVIFFSYMFFLFRKRLKNRA